jgi:hypothetical protein
MADNFNMKQFLMENKLGAYSRLKENKETVKTKYGNLELTQDEDGEWEYSFKGSKGGVGQGMVDGGFSSKESAIKAFEKSAASELDEAKEDNVTIELYQGTKLTGPKDNETEARKLAKEIEQAMKSAFSGAKGAGDESAAMDERDDTVYEFEDELSELGFKIDLSEAKEKEEEGYMGTQYGSSEDMAVDMIKKGITEDETLNEYEVIYREINGKCYRIDDEGNRDEVSMSYCMRYAEGKEEKEEAFGGINERLSPQAFSYMAGISNEKAQIAMIKAAEILMNDLTAEGFEVEDIREFLTQLIANDI